MQLLGKQRQHPHPVCLRSKTPVTVTLPQQLKRISQIPHTAIPTLIQALTAFNRLLKKTIGKCYWPTKKTRESSCVNRPVIGVAPYWASYRCILKVRTKDRTVIYNSYDLA
jgi:hypothetical protein